MTVFSRQLLFAVFISGLLFSCGSGGDEDKEALTEETDTIKSAVFNVGGELFSIPSPIQTALMVQKSGISYDKSVLSMSNMANSYMTDQARALNLGVYGADLAYVSLFNQTQDAIGYLSAIKQLSDRLGLNSAFDAGTMERIKTNITNKDSMTMLVGVAYRGSDAYLKTNKRSDISTLILIGGWLESMHFSIAAFRAKPSDGLRYRIAEQKQALNSIIKILGTETVPEVKELHGLLSDLSKDYEKIQFKYTFVEPIHDTVKKVSYINSTSEVIVSDEELSKISAKVIKIRNKIVNPHQS